MWFWRWVFNTNIPFPQWLVVVSLKKALWHELRKNNWRIGKP